MADAVYVDLSLLEGKVADAYLVSLDQHGASLASLYRLVEKHRASVEGRAAANLLAVRDSDDNLFGVFMTDSIQKREGSYYGSGET